MTYISTNVNVDVDIDLRDLYIDDLLDALEYFLERNKDIEYIREFCIEWAEELGIGIYSSEKGTLDDIFKQEVLSELGKKYTTAQLEEFLNK